MGAVSLGRRQCPGPLCLIWSFLRALVWVVCLVVLVSMLVVLSLVLAIWVGLVEFYRSFFFFDYSRLLSVLGGSWMLADVALGCGWSAVGGVGEGGGGGGGGGGDGGGVVLAGRVVAAVLGSYWFSSWQLLLL